MSLLAPTIQAALLMLSAAASAVWIGSARRGYGEADQPALFCALLCFVMAAAAGGCAVAHQAFGLDTLGAQRWLQQATQLLGFPLIGAVALTLGRRWVWSRPNWGRVLLGLCAFFELARQLGWSQPYALGLGLVSALLVLYSGLLQWPGRTQVAMAVLGCALMLAAMPWSETLSGSTLLPGNPLLYLALACPILACLLLNLPGNSRESSPVRA